MPPKKKKTASGYRMPDHLAAGTTLSDLNKKQWILGNSIGTGGFGEIYLATEGGKGESRVVKIEPHENGPLFVEMHFYTKAGKPEHLAEWNKSRKGKALPNLPLLRGHGSYMHKGTDNYRFLVIDRLGQDLDKSFKNGANPLSASVVANVSTQVLTALEYIHSRGFTHNDVKAANLLMGTDSGSKDVYLVDFGLCVKYIKGADGGSHKEYKPDPKKAHDGTIEYLSRDAHIGCTSRRSDMEVLGFNIIHWLTGSLPWSGITNNPGKVQSAKVSFMKDLEKNMASMPKEAREFMKYVSKLEFDEEPDYDKLRGIFTPIVKKSGGIIQLNTSNGHTPKGKKGVKKSGDSDIKEDESDVSVKKTIKGRPRVKKVPVVESDSENELEPSPVPAKKPKTAQRKKNVVEVKENGCESDDMFETSPTNKVISRPILQEVGCQTSPAFVAASRAARKGKLALAQSEYLVGDMGKNRSESPSGGKNVRNTPVKSGRSSTRNTPSKRHTENAPTEDGLESGIANPTPAMLEILQRKKQAEQDKAAKKRKKT